MAAKKSSKKKPIPSHANVDAPLAARLDALEGTVEELTEVIRALMRDSAAATKHATSSELRLRALERKAGPRAPRRPATD